MFIGIDLGTSSLKASAVLHNGEIVAACSESYELLTPQEGWCEQNPADWASAMFLSIKKLGEKVNLSKVQGISFSGQMHGLVCLDENNKVIRPAILWNDQRTALETDYLNESVGLSKLVQWTGNRAVTGFTAPKVLWMKNNEPENFAKIRKIMLPKDYLAFLLSGVFATDVSDASGTLFFDVKNRCWSKPMLELLSIQESMLPTVYESSQAIGSVALEVAQTTGLSITAKVVIGGGDQAVGAIGTGTVAEGNISVSLGTSGVVFAACDSFYNEEQGLLHNFCHANNKYHYMGVTLAAGASRSWIAETLSIDDFGAIDKKIKELGIDSLIYTPYLTGERSPIFAPQVKGGLFGLTLQTTPAHIMKAVMEGVAFSLRDCLQVMRDVGVKIDKARCIGGGSKSDVWMQILADVLQVPICRINTADGGALGAAILAMVGTGLYASVEDACSKLIKDEKKFYPNADNVTRYNEKFAQYKDFQQYSLRSASV